MSSSVSTPPRIPACPPPWADVFGEDPFGIFAEIDHHESRFVFRWIIPGAVLTKENVRIEVSRGFWLGETPVTRAQWRAVTGQEQSRFTHSEDLPVESVSWDDCQKFIHRLNEGCAGLLARLPREMEWEFACRAGSTGDFGLVIDPNTGAVREGTADEMAWHGGTSPGQTQPVKQKVPNRWGLHEMHGNVWEWCADTRSSALTESRHGGERRPDEGNRAGRVVRGGSWLNPAGYCRAAGRFRIDPGERWSDLGFRLAAGQEPGAAEPTGVERRG